MRFKYLTATMLREAANMILNGESIFMCTTIGNKNGWPAREEFEKLLKEMQVSLCGNLFYYISPKDTYAVSACDNVNSVNDRETRAFFLYMLADAIAYKAPKKIDYRWRDPFMEPPEVPGVYERDFGQIEESDKPDFQYWDGVVWHYGNYSFTETEARKFNVDSVAYCQDRKWRHVRPELKKT